MDARELLNKRVFITSICEFGTVTSYHNDGSGDPVFVVIRDSDGERHLCRNCELEAQMSYNELSDALEDNVAVVRHSLQHPTGA